jgi:hypothetical protein
MTLRIIKRSLIALLLLLVPAIATAQTPSSPAPTSSDQLLKPEQLAALVSPVALYPDSLLSTVLMASTYPLEIVQAERWLTQNKNLSGDALKTAVEKQIWDESVKALIATPPVLAMMSSELDWTQKLGDAVLAQQPDVIDAIQRLRLRAQDNGKLTTTPEQKVSVEQQDNRRTVVIEQTSDDTVYVPAYDPAVAFGAWPYAEYPPYYWGYPDYWGYPAIGAGVLARGLWFGTGYALGRWGSGNYAWGGRVNWGNGNLVRNWPRATPYNVTNINNIGNNWQHNPAHRGGVRYNNASVQQRFGNANRAAGGRGNLGGGNLGGGNLGSHLGAAAIGAGAGAALRGGAGNRQAQRPNAGNRQAQRPNAGNRQAQRPNAGNRQAQRPNAGNRQAQRPNAGNRQAQRPSAGNRQAQQRAANRPSQRTAARPGGGARSRAQSIGGGARGGGIRPGGGGGFRGGGGGGFRGGGGRGGARRSDIRLKHDLVLLGHLDNGLGFYRFDYNGSDKAYVGVIAQEVQAIMPQAVTRDRDGYLRVFYDKLGVTFETYDHWIASGARVPSGATR